MSNKKSRWTNSKKDCKCCDCESDIVMLEPIYYVPDGKKVYCFTCGKKLRKNDSLNIGKLKT